MTEPTEAFLRPTLIISCGLPGAEREPDALDTLLRVLGEYQLDPRFLRCGGFVRLTRRDGQVRFHGNFLALSHVFDARTDDLEVVYALASAINANLDREWPAFDLSRGSALLPRWAP